MDNIDFKNKIILAIDYGTKVVGLALYNWGNDPYPLPYGKIAYKSDQQVIQELLKVAQEELVDVIVLGIPFFTDGTASKMTEKVRLFGKELQKHIPNTPFFTQDETLTSFEAQERMKSSPRYQFKVDPKQIDALSASIILEDFVKRQTQQDI